MKQRDVVLYGALALGAWWLYTKFKGGINAAVDTLTAPLARAYVGLTAPGAPIPQGSVIFPDGSSIPVSSITPTWYGSALTFAYNGGGWQLQPQVNGNYPAIPYVGA